MKSFMSFIAGIILGALGCILVIPSFTGKIRPNSNLSHPASEAIVHGDQSVTNTPESLDDSMRKIVEIRKKTVRDEAIYEWLAKLPLDKFSEAISLIDTMSLRHADARNLRHLIIQKWAERDPEGAVAFFKENSKTMSYERKKDFMTTLASAWASYDPKAATESKSLDNEGVLMRGFFMAAAAAAWMTSSPDDALQWMKSQPITMQEKILISITASPNNIDPENAPLLLDMISNLNASTTLWKKRYENIIYQLAVDNPLAAIDYIQKNTNNGSGFIASNALSSVIKAISTTDPKLALQQAQEIPDPTENLFTSAAVINNWVLVDPIGAMSDVIAMPEDNPNRQQLIANVVNMWAGRDLLEASSWVQKMPDSSERDMALCLLAQSPATAAMPELALKNANAINNPDMREFALKQLQSPGIYHRPAITIR